MGLSSPFVSDKDSLFKPLLENTALTDNPKLHDREGEKEYKSKESGLPLWSKERVQRFVSKIMTS